jgi:DNA-binding GntR family transcriptional regulator
VSAKKKDRADPTARIRKGIESGHFMPNERLVEVDLATWLGTNRANVRLALGRLEQEGLVVSEPNRGARVRLVSEVEAIEIAQAREALEGVVAREAALRATKSDMLRLREILDEMRSAMTMGDLLAYSDKNGKFHAEIRRIADHKTATRLLTTLNSQIVRFQFRTVMIPGRVQQSIKEHGEIVAAIENSDPNRAEAAMRKHLASVIAALKVASSQERRPHS